jgi:UDP-N-acetylglucosamine 2-epimerase (non-hydrolysing)
VSGPQTPAKILAVVGTRPEGVKMAPVIEALRASDWCRVRVLNTAQHRQLLDDVFDAFSIRPDLDLDLMQSNQSLAALTGRLAIRLDEVLESEAPDMVLAQGDTTTVMMTALCCFYRGIPFGHVEAGLRTGDRRFPFPEEMNRVFAGYLGDLHFAPTTTARDNLLKEGVPGDAIHVTGNTVIDALLQQAGRADAAPLPIREGLRTILVTAHRRENFGAPLQAACDAVLDLVARYDDVQVLFPVHPNPNVRRVVDATLRGNARIHLCEPLGYREFVAAMQSATLILTDSGGVQEEAPALAKPVLVLRAETERPEAVDAGVVRLVGTDRQRIVAEASRLLDDSAAYADMARGVSPYGDGKAAGRIAGIIRGFLEARRG